MTTLKNQSDNRTQWAKSQKKYILSKIHSYRLLFQEYNHMKKINRITECRNENNQQKKVRLIKCITP